MTSARSGEPGKSGKNEWLEQAWVDWIRPLGLLVVAALAYLGYRFDLIPERGAGIALVLAILFGLLAVGVLPAWSLVRRGSDRVLVGVLVVLALGGAAWPSLRTALSPAPLAVGYLSTAQPKATLDTGAAGPYELVVRGRLKGGGDEAEASYTIELDGAGKEQISGELKRTLHRYRTSRRGGSSISLEEHTESVHRLKEVQGRVVEVTTRGLSELLEGGLEVALRSAPPRPELFWALGALAILLGLVLDLRLTTVPTEDERALRGGKRELSYLTCVAAMLLVFSINYPMEATPSSLVKAAVGAFFLALLVGGAGGWLITAFARLAVTGKRRG